MTGKTNAIIPKVDPLALARREGSADFLGAPIVANITETIEDETLGEMEIDSIFNHRSVENENFAIVRVSTVMEADESEYDDKEYINVGVIVKRNGTAVYREFSVYGNLKNNLRARFFTGDIPTRDKKGFLPRPFMTRIEKAPTKAGFECWAFTTPVRKETE